MLKRIPVSDVRMGMYIARFEGSWLNHPFWRARFLLADEHRLRAVRNSRVKFVLIDVSKGSDVDPVALPLRMPDAPEEPSRVARRGQTWTAAPAIAVSMNGTPFLQRTHVERVAAFGKARSIAQKAESELAAMIMEMKLGAILNVRKVAGVVDDIFASVERDAFAFTGLMRCKQGAPNIYRHSLAVSGLMIAFARKLGHSAPEVRIAGQAGLLMDVGHAYLGPGSRSEDHTTLGYEALSGAQGLAHSVLDVCLRHHERLDGSGFPAGLKGEAIDQLSRMAAICDAFTEMSETDGEMQLSDPVAAVAHLAAHPEQFCPELVTRFVEVVGRYPVGSFVALRTGRLAMVVFGDTEGSDLPTVRTFYNLATGKRLRGENIDMRNCYGSDEIIGAYDVSSLDAGTISTLRERILNAALKQ